MNTENPLWNPSRNEEGDDPPSYNAACFPRPPQMPRVTLVATPVQGDGIEHVLVGQNTHDEHPPSYEVVCGPEDRHQPGLQTVDHSSNPNLRATFEQSGTSFDCSPSSQIVFSDRQKRHNFVRNLYASVSAHLVITSVLTLVLLHYTRQWMPKSPDFSFVEYLIICPLLSLILVLGPCFCTLSLSKSLPGKTVSLVLYTLELGFSLVIASIFVQDGTILVSVILTTIACIFLTIFATIFSTVGGSSILLAVAVLLVIFAFLTLENAFSITQQACACFAALLFSTFLVYDTNKMLMGSDNESVSISWENYISALLTFHKDIIFILSFIILALFTISLVVFSIVGSVSVAVLWWW